MEAVLSFGLTEDMLRAAETAVEEFYTGVKPMSGEEADKISEVWLIKKMIETGKKRVLALTPHTASCGGNVVLFMVKYTKCQ